MVDVATVLVGIALYQAQPKEGSSMLYSSQDNFLSFGFKVSITELDVFLYIVSDGQKKSTGVKDPTLHFLCPAGMSSIVKPKSGQDE